MLFDYETDEIDINIDPNDFTDGNDDDGDDGNGESDSKSDDVKSKADENENGNAKAENKDESEDQKRKSREEYEKRKAERERKKKAHEDQIREETKLKTVREHIKENPWTKKPINDKYDLEEYELMKSLEERGLDPIEDYSNEVKKQRIERDKAETERAEKAEREMKEKVDSVKEYFSNNREDLRELTHKDEKTGKIVINDELLNFLDSPENQGMKFAQAVRLFKLESAAKKGKGDDRKAADIAKKMTGVPSSAKQGEPVDSQKWLHDDEAFKKKWESLSKR